MHNIFRIGDFVFRITCTEDLPIPENILKFAVSEETPAFSYNILLSEQLPALVGGGRVLVQREDLVVLDQDGLQTRYIGIKGAGFYGCCRDTGSDGAEIILLWDILPELGSDPVFVSLFALERHLLKEDGLVLHCAYLRHQGEAILFSAPSEIGKSTQAGLWERYRGAKTINGDRALLEMRDGRWIAKGWPVCGSSGICENTDTPIRAIVMLSQAKEDQIRRLTPAAAFFELFPQLTINRWDREALNRGIAIAESLVSNVPVWHLGCTISENAVQCLEKALEEALEKATTGDSQAKKNGR